MFNKKGEGLSTNTIVYLILALLVLILIILIFTGQFDSIYQSVKIQIENVLGVKTNFSDVVK